MRTIRPSRSRVASPRAIVIDNRLGALCLRDAASRHLRWARIRRAMSPAAFAAEILLSPVAIALVAALALRTPAAFALLAAAAALKVALDGAALASLGSPIDVSLPAISMLRDLGAAALWPAAWLGRSVTWRGRPLRIGARTLIETPATERILVPVRPSVALATK